MKSGKIELDGGVLAGVDAVGGSVADDVDDHEDVQASNSEASLEVVPWTDLIWIQGKFGFGVKVDVEEVVSLDFEPQVKGRIKVSSFVIDF